MNSNKKFHVCCFSNTQYKSCSREAGIFDAVRFYFWRRVAGAVQEYCPATPHKNKNEGRENSGSRGDCFMTGVAALPTIMVIALIVLVAGIGVMSTGFVENAVTFGEEESREALYAAESGIHDAVLRINRNKNCESAGIPACASYSFPVGAASVAVAVTGAGSPKTVLATGTIKNKTRRIQATATIDGNNKVIVSAWTELTN